MAAFCTACCAIWYAKPDLFDPSHSPIRAGIGECLFFGLGRVSWMGWQQPTLYSTHSFRTGLRSVWMKAFSSQCAALGWQRTGHESSPAHLFKTTTGVRRPWRKQGLGMALLLYSFGEFHRRGETTIGLGVDARPGPPAQRACMSGPECRRPVRLSSTKKNIAQAGSCKNGFGAANPAQSALCHG